MKRPVEFDGFNFENNGFIVTDDIASEDVSVDGLYVLLGEDEPSFAGISLQPRSFSFPVIVPGYRPREIQASLIALRRGLRMDLAEERTLRVTDWEYRELEMRCRPRRFVRGEGHGIYRIVWEAGENYWRSRHPVTEDVTGPASAGGSVSVAVALGGEVDARPVITLTPQQPKEEGQTYSRVYTVTNNDSVDLYRVPAVISFDHEQAVYDGKSQADGSDIIVRVEGATVPSRVVDPDEPDTEVVFALTCPANGTVTVEISYGAQEYTGGPYAEAALAYIIQERSGNTFTDYPYMLPFDHAAYVAAGLSNADGSDIRVWHDDVELDRDIENPNNAATRVWFPLPVSASGSVVISITMASSDYAYAGAGWGGVDFSLSLSDNEKRAFDTPDVQSSDSPGVLKPIALQVNSGFSLPTDRHTATATAGGNPGVRTASTEVTGSNQLGNFIRLYEGGIPITTVSYAVTHINLNNRSRTVIASSDDLTSWDVEQAWQHDLVTPTTRAYTTETINAGAIAVALGNERANVTEDATTLRQYAIWHGDGSNELQYTLDDTQIPLASEQSALTVSGGNETFAYTLNGRLQILSPLQRIEVDNLTIPAGRAVVIDCARRTGYLLDISGLVISGSALTVAPRLRFSGQYNDWLHLRPGQSTTISWIEPDMAENGMKIDVEVTPRWH